MKEWLELALEPRVAARAVKYAIFVGTLLIVINHGDNLLKGELTSGRLLKIGLTILVPYGVSMFSSIGAIREARRGLLEHRPLSPSDQDSKFPETL